MKRSTNTLTAVTLEVMAAFCLTSCIWEDGFSDRYYRTLWECTEVPLGPFQANELELEFLCGGNVRLQSDAFPGAIYGTYETDGQSAIFQSLTIEIEGYVVTFIDASVSSNTLFLRWRIENSVYPFTTPMLRLTSYN